jgi:hypothetical protein
VLNWDKEDQKGNDKEFRLYHLRFKKVARIEKAHAAVTVILAAARDPAR